MTKSYYWITKCRLSLYTNFTAKGSKIMLWSRQGQQSQKHLENVIAKNTRHIIKRVHFQAFQL